MFGRVAIVAAVAAALLSPAASAAPSCPLASDPSGDTDSLYQPDPAGDLLAVDVASDDASLTVRMRLAELRPEAVAIGHIYDVYVGDGERGVKLSATVDSGKASFWLAHGDSEGPGGTGVYMYLERSRVRGRFDVAAKTVTIWAPLTEVGFGKGRQLAVRAITWQSQSTDNVAGLPEPAQQYFEESLDFLDRTAHYRSGAAACMPVEH